jgi:hypothetical protein
MDANQRESLVTRITAGVQVLNVCGSDYILKSPNKLQKYQAHLEYERALKDFEFEGHLTKEGAKAALISLNIVPSDIDQKLSKIESDIDKLKHQLYINTINPQPQKIRSLREALKLSRQMYFRFVVNLHMLDYLTSEGYAEMSKMYRLFFFCLQTLQGKSVQSPHIIEKAIIKASSQRLTNEELRELARTEPWRSVWNAYGKSVFRNDYSEDQRTLILYSQMYDSVYKANETPADFIIQDDDLLDGWMINQKKEHDKEKKIKGLNKKGGSHFENADEIYQFKTQDDSRSNSEFIDETNGLNSIEAQIIKAQRFAAIKSKGKLNEAQLPDVQRELQIKAQQQVMERFKTRK